MSEPPNTSVQQQQHPPPPPIVVPYPNPYLKQLPHHLPILHGATAATSSMIATTTTTPPNLREYRKGNWTLEETLILITAKRLDDERRINNATSSSPNSTTSRATGELRWKWVENYCWNNGCLRSQNQCNDKWDNLLRDYKKVREYEVRLDSSSSSSQTSYWAMDKTQRKDRNLPSNLIFKIYEALNDVVQKKYPPITRPPPPAAAAAALSSIQHPLTILPPPPFPPPLPPPPHPPPPPPPAAVAISEASSESDGISGEELGEEREKVDPETKRRRRVLGDIESSITHSTSVLAKTLKSCEEKRERRHREIMQVEEQRLRMEESRNEMNRQGLSSLVTSVNNLSTAIHALISDRRDKP